MSCARFRLKSMTCILGNSIRDDPASCCKQGICLKKLRSSSNIRFWCFLGHLCRWWTQEVRDNFKNSALLVGSGVPKCPGHAHGTTPGRSSSAPSKLSPSPLKSRGGPRKTRETEQRAKICTLYTTAAAFPGLRLVLQRCLLLRQSAERVGRTLRLLKGSAHAELLVLAVRQAGVSQGTFGGLLFMAPAPIAVGDRERWSGWQTKADGERPRCRETFASLGTTSGGMPCS